MQAETTLAAVQTGWIQAIKMRTVGLLGRKDDGAAKSFALMCLLAAGTVAVTVSVPLLIWNNEISAAVSNDLEVQHWFNQIGWVLVIHVQSRISSINASSLFIPIGRGSVGLGLTFLSFYVIATPIAAVGALTDVITSSVATKMQFCVGASSIAQVIICMSLSTHAS